MKNLTALIAVILLTACASAGVRVDQSKMTQFTKGKTTETEVISALGAPTNRMQNDDNTHAIQYIYSSSQPRPETFIPYVGMFVGGVDTENTIASFTFDKRGVLIHSSHTQGGMGVGTGFEAMSQDRKSVREVE